MYQRIAFTSLLAESILEFICSDGMHRRLGAAKSPPHVNEEAECPKALPHDAALPCKGKGNGRLTSAEK